MTPRFEVRPLGPWVGAVTKPRRFDHFRASWNDTVDLLLREAGLLDARTVVVQVDAPEGQIRRDGMLYAHAQVSFPGVRVSFDSRFGPLTYATDAYHDWRGNVRAIGLALTALRAVDRYGVSRRGEQYTGWAALPAGPSGRMSADAAARLLAEYCDWPPEVLLSDRDIRTQAYRAAAKANHPDRGGDRALFERLTEARRLLDATDGAR